MDDHLGAPTASTASTEPIAVAEDFAEGIDDRAAAKERERAYNLQWRAAQDAHARQMSRIWGSVFTFVVAGVLALAGYAIYCHTHTDSLKHAPDNRVTVWCYADPNSGRATSSFSGTPDQVRSICPDVRSNG